LTSSPTDARGYIGRRRTILIVDDIADNRSLLTDFFRPLGFTRSKRPGLLREARRERPDLIVTDVVMKPVDGLQVTRLLGGHGRVGVPAAFIGCRSCT